MQREHLGTRRFLLRSQSVPTGPYIATLQQRCRGFGSVSIGPNGTVHCNGTKNTQLQLGKLVSIGPNGTVHCNRLFYDRDNLFTRNSLPISCLQEILPASSKFDESVSPPSHSLAVFVIRSFRPPGLCLDSHHPPRTTYKSIKPTRPIQGACR